MSPTTAPLAFSGSRLHWSDLPREVRARIARLAGADVISETSATSGFSPGYAALLGLGNGTQVFVKAVSPEQNPGSPDLARREIAVAAGLPRQVLAPRLWWHDDDGTWVLLGFQPVDGRAPVLPWRDDELARVLGAVAELATVEAPASAAFPPVAGALADLAACWRLLEADGADADAAVAAVGPHGEWLRRELPALVELAAPAPAAGAGRSLVHHDLRADNVMVTEDLVWLIDWPHAGSGGAPWYDLLGMLPSVAMQGGGDPEEIFWSQPTTRDADRDAVRTVLAAVAGYFVRSAVQPPPPGIANLRPFQLAQGVAALDWLRRL